MEAIFRLSEAFLERYRHVPPAFGFGGLGEVVFYRTYSRIKTDGTNEGWWETVARVVNGCYRMQERHIKAHKLGWDDRKAQQSAQEMYDRIFTFKFLPPGRGLWAMGTELTEERGLFAALNNCGFVSTEKLAQEGARPFCFLMDASMLGIGVGFDTRGAGTVMVHSPPVNEAPYPFGTFFIPDSREGWVESVRQLIDAYLYGTTRPLFDYSAIRAANQPIVGFGGVSSGPEPLRQLHASIAGCLAANEGAAITLTTIVDLMNLIGCCVVAGNVRRTAEIVFGDPDSDEYLDLKNYRWSAAESAYVGPAAGRSGWGWASNNSVFATVGMDYRRIAERIARNGEPGVAWLENMRGYGRMIDGMNNKDHRVAGGNPCLEQSLEPYELCCLVESYPNNHADLADFERSLKFAYLYAKTVTLGSTHWPETNRVMLRNRRIGTSMSGIQQFVAARGLHEFKRWCESGYAAVQRYDRIYSDWFAVPVSVKTTSVKPSGTVSLLAGATPGMHWPESLHYLRRLRLSIDSPLVERLRQAGFTVEPCVGQEESTVVVEFPVAVEDPSGRLRTVAEVSLWEQVAMAAFLQTYWADNQVSCTVTFDPRTETGEIDAALNYFQYRLKGISLLPRTAVGAYAQMPYEAISAPEYGERWGRLQRLSFAGVGGEAAEAEKFCDSAGCLLGGAA